MTGFDVRMLRPLWRLLWLAPPLYAAAGWMVRIRLPHPPPGPSTTVMAASLALMVVHTVAWVWVDVRFGSPVVRCLSRWLLAELTAFVAMLLFVTGGPPWLVLAAFAWALALHVLAVPPGDDPEDAAHGGPPAG